MSKQHASFVKGFIRSQVGVQLVTQWLTSLNVDVMVYGYTVAKTAEEAPEHSDTGDLCVRKKGGKWEMCGAKWLTTDFTCEDDWPWPDFLVVKKSQHDKAVDEKRGPVRYFLVNNNKTHVAIVDVAETIDKWTYRDVEARNLEKPVKYVGYVCPVELVTFKRIWPDAQ